VSPRLDPGRVGSDFLKGKIRVLIATSALSYGLDVPNIQAIIHFGLPYRLYDYAQETGRGGRDGRNSEAILLIPSSSSRTSLSTQFRPRPTKVEVFENEVIQRYISNICRRATLGGYLDGEEIEKCVYPAVSCNFCVEEDIGKSLDLFSIIH